MPHLAGTENPLPRTICNILAVGHHIGYGFGFTHAKTYMAAEDRAALGFSRFELTDGHNIITANVFRRWPGRWGQYARIRQLDRLC